ncbi:hypothetical protein U9M48_036061, partial [Paspalum notatum var. saurae]
MKVASIQRICVSSHRPPDEEWTLQIECMGAPRQRDVVELVIDKAYITFSNLCVLKDKLGYSARDFMYYKKRCATYVASLEVIDYEHQARAMVGDKESERKVRLIMAKESLNELSVSITPIKRRREQHQEDLPCVQEGIDAYKVWLSELLVENLKIELKDEFRKQTIETYKQWLTLQGDLPGDDITNDVRTSTENGENDRHCTGERKKGRGPLKGHSVAFKRIKSGCQKLPIEFSSRLGGPVGANYRSFVDEVNRWDFGNILEAQVDKKILGIARSRYAGWRSTLNATYKAYESDAERAKHKPVDVDSVEWHYLMKYFATEKFQREIIPCKRTAIHGHGYMAKYPTRAELMDAQIKQSRATAAEQERNKQLEGVVQRLREEHADQTAQTDRKVEEATQKIQKEEAIKREEMRKQIKEDMAAFFALQTQASTLQ